MGHPRPEQHEQFWELSHCTLRDVKITEPFWTYCRNFEYGEHPESRDKEEKPTGMITVSGLYEGYVRIPWDDNNEPHTRLPATCSICGRVTDSGIEIAHKGEALGFCTNRHYLEWWVSVHHDDSYRPEDYQSPEDKYRAK
jgi:hypothetical protein